MDLKQSSEQNPSHPPVSLHPGQHLHGFEVKAVTPIDELRAVAIELLHPHSGARLLHFYPQPMHSHTTSLDKHRRCSKIGTHNSDAQHPRR